MFKGICLTGLVMSLLALPAYAQSSRISEDREEFSITLNGATVSIQRDGAACPPNCLLPMRAAPSVATVAELEVLDFLELFVANGRGLLIDTRLPSGYAAGTIPGAVNVPAETLRADNPYRDDLLNALGVRSADFSDAFDLVIFAEGPDAPGAAQALRDLVDAGYPASKLKYYRGGMLVWSALGLSTAAGQ